jgi:dephospho-CoA kinase
MGRPLLIGITGGIGAGKSTVASVFSSLGVPVYDADSRAKALMTTDGILMGRIREEFGELCYRNDGSLNREYLAQQVFGVPERLKKLNSLVHPRVREDFERWADSHKDKPYVLKEAALLFESGSWKELDAIVLVSAPEAMREHRVLSRDPHRTAQQVKEIMSNQLPESDTRERATHIIENDGLQPLLPRVLKLHGQFSQGRIN